MPYARCCGVGYLTSTIVDLLESRGWNFPIGKFEVLSDHWHECNAEFATIHVMSVTWRPTLLHKAISCVKWGEYVNTECRCTQLILLVQ